MSYKFGTIKGNTQKRSREDKDDPWHYDINSSFTDNFRDIQTPPEDKRKITGANDKRNPQEASSDCDDPLYRSQHMRSSKPFSNNIRNNSRPQSRHGPAHRSESRDSSVGICQRRENRNKISKYHIPRKSTYVDNGRMPSPTKNLASMVTKGIRSKRHQHPVRHAAEEFLDVEDIVSTFYETHGNEGVNSHEGAVDEGYETQEDEGIVHRRKRRLPNTIPTDQAVRSCPDDECDEIDLCEVVHVENVVQKSETANMKASMSRRMTKSRTEQLNKTPQQSVDRMISFGDSSPKPRYEGICHRLDDHDKVETILTIVKNDPVRKFPEAEDPVVDIKEQSWMSRTFSTASNAIGKAFNLKKVNGPKKVIGKSRSKGHPINATSTISVANFFGVVPQDTASKTDPIEEFDQEKTSSQGTVESEQRRSTRYRRVNHGMDNPIEIDDSADDASSTPSSSRAKEALQVFKFTDLVRVTIGSREVNVDCKLGLSVDQMMIRYSFKSLKRGMSSTQHLIREDELREFHHFVSEEETTVLAVLRVEPNESNGLDQVSKYLRNTETLSIDRHRSKKGYIVLLFHSKDNLQTLLEWMRKISLLGPFLKGAGATLRSWEECMLYAETMLKSTERDKVKRKRKKHANSKEVWLVFPFETAQSEIDSAAHGLNELRHVIEQPVTIDHDGNTDQTIFNHVQYLNASSDSDAGIEPIVSTTIADDVKKRIRAHYLTIRQEDVDRLEPGEFLNDTLIDFWMEWLMHKEDRESSPLHVFSSHFYTTLSEDGVNAVESWTARKNINIFTKRFVFLPINKSLHWSLCVVVNPFSILNEINIKSDNNHDSPCILFLDSLKAHRKDVVAKHVRHWLNAEWKRLMEPQHGGINPFTEATIGVFTPKIPYQNNSWDCGVFVCRYAYALFMLRHKKITISQQTCPLQALADAITDRDEFDFDMKDIERIRSEMKILISRLATLYISEKENRDSREKQSSKAEKCSENNSSPALCVDDDDDDDINSAMMWYQEETEETSDVDMFEAGIKQETDSVRGDML